MDIICNRCGYEDVFFNGVSYECPNCENEWGFVDEDNDNFESEDANDEGYNMEQFIRYSALDKPFFKLKHGKLYRCSVEYDFGGKQGMEETTILILAFEENKNNLFILINPLEIQKKYPNAISDFAKMDFKYIWNDGINSYFEDFKVMPLTEVCATCEDGTLLSNNSIFFGFEEVE